ncbi:MAG: TatD family hydrolase [Spirochaetota bacterium]
MVTFSHTSQFPALLDAHLHLTHASSVEYPDHFHYFTNSASPDEWPSVAELTSDNILPFFGIHPECGPGPIDDLGWETSLYELSQVAVTYPAGIGECGIDNRYYDTFSKSQQISLCRAQIETAARLHRPLTLHLVDRSEDLLKLIEENTPASPWIMHGFTGSLKTARRVLDLGGSLSIGPELMMSPEKLLQITRFIPDKQLLLETDYPYTWLTPDWSAYSYEQILYQWYCKVAEIRSRSVSSLVQTVLENGAVFSQQAAGRNAAT